MQKITPFLWFDADIKEAVDFYSSVFKSLKIKGDRELSNGVRSASIEIEGQPMVIFNGGPMFKLNESFSFSVNCDTQEEIDFYWERLVAGGGAHSQCGWLKDKYGLFWQIVPSVLESLLYSEEKEAAAAATQAMLQMQKLDIEALKRAYAEGKSR